MEILQWLVLSFAIVTLLSALIIFLRHSVLGEVLSNCCSQLCNANDHHTVSHLDSYTLRVHYRTGKEDVVIEGLTVNDRGIGHCNPAYSSCDSVDTELNRDIILSPLPASLRSQCPTSACQVTYPNPE